jgi:hypothetical protein
MDVNPLTSLAAYSHFVAEFVSRSTVDRSTIVVWSDSPHTGIAEGEIFFRNGFRLRLREELDFDAHLIASYGYEVYKGEERLYWYDDFPHPELIELASSFPHHKHVLPNPRRNRVPAPEMSFTRPNLSFLIDEIERLLKEATPPAGI